MADDNGNSIRVTNREIYDVVTELKNEFIEHRATQNEKLSSLSFQVKLLWGAWTGALGTFIGLAVKTLS